MDSESVAAIRRTFEERLKQNPNDPDAHYNIGLTLYDAALSGARASALPTSPLDEELCAGGWTLGVPLLGAAA